MNVYKLNEDNISVTSFKVPHYRFIVSNLNLRTVDEIHQHASIAYFLNLIQLYLAYLKMHDKRFECNRKNSACIMAKLFMFRLPLNWSRMAFNWSRIHFFKKKLNNLFFSPSIAKLPIFKPTKLTLKHRWQNIFLSLMMALLRSAKLVSPS